MKTKTFFKVITALLIAAYAVSGVIGRPVNDAELMRTALFCRALYTAAFALVWCIFFVPKVSGPLLFMTANILAVVQNILMDAHAAIWVCQLVILAVYAADWFYKKRWLHNAAIILYGLYIIPVMAADSVAGHINLFDNSITEGLLYLLFSLALLREADSGKKSWGVVLIGTGLVAAGTVIYNTVMINSSADATIAEWSVNVFGPVMIAYAVILVLNGAGIILSGRKWSGLMPIIACVVMTVVEAVNLIRTPVFLGLASIANIALVITGAVLVAAHVMHNSRLLKLGGALLIGNLAVMTAATWVSITAWSTVLPLWAPIGAGLLGGAFLSEERR